MSCFKNDLEILETCFYRGQRSWLVQRSHQMGWRSIWSATPGVLDLISISVYNWKLHLKQDHKVSKGAKNRPTKHSAWNLNLLMHSLPQSQSSRVNSVPDTSKKCLKKFSNTHRQLSSNSGVPTHLANHFPGIGLLELYNLSCGGNGEPSCTPSLEKHFEYFRSAKYLVKE